MSLQTCIATMSAGELLTGDSAYQCERCNRKVTATRRLRLHKLPPALLLHLNRAQWQARAGGRREKLAAHVPFPLILTPGDLAAAGALTEAAVASLQPSDVAAGAGAGAGARAGAGGFAGGSAAGGASGMLDAATSSCTDASSSYSSSSSSASSSSPISQWHYRLQSVIVHRARGLSIDTGHYTAYCYEEDRDAWCLFDDAKVSAVYDNEVRAAQAYMLAYERVEGPPPLPHRQ